MAGCRPLPWESGMLLLTMSCPEPEGLALWLASKELTNQMLLHRR